MEKIVTKIGDVTIERRVSKPQQPVVSLDPPPGNNMQQSAFSGPNNNPPVDGIEGHQPWQMNFGNFDLPMFNKNVPFPPVQNNFLNSLHQGGNFDLKPGISVNKQTDAGNYSEYPGSFYKEETAKLQGNAPQLNFSSHYMSNIRPDASVLQGKDDDVTLPKMPRIDEIQRQPFPSRVNDNQPKNLFSEADLSKYSGISIERRKRIDLQPTTAKPPPPVEHFPKTDVLNPSTGIRNLPLPQEPANANDNLEIQQDDDFSEDEFDESYDEEEYEDENIGFDEDLEQPEDFIEPPPQPIDITDDEIEKLEIAEGLASEKTSIKDIEDLDDVDDVEEGEEEEEEEGGEGELEGKGVETVKLEGDEGEQQEIKQEMGDEEVQEALEGQESIKEEEEDLIKEEEEEENEDEEDGKDADITDLVELMQKGEIEGEIEDVKEEVLSDSENKGESGKRKAEDDGEGGGEEGKKEGGEEGEKKEKSDKKKCRKKKKTDNKKDGEKKEEGNDDDIDKSKVTNANLRKNIREVMDETKLDEATISAQRQEAERLKRLQEQQRIIREVQRQIALNRVNQKTQNKVLSLLQGNSQTSILKTSSLASQTQNTQGKSQNSVLVKLSNGEQTSLNNKKMIELLKNSKNKSVLGKPPISKTLLKQGMVSPSVTIAPIAKKEPVVEDKKKSVVTISSDSEDDCIVLSDEDESEPEEDPTNSGMHTNDKYNLPDEKGRVVVNVGHPESESDLYLAPQIARIIKPHQIGGIRFLYDNVIESIERFQSSTGFGCILAHSMGLGKTLQIVSFSDIFLRYTSAKTILCIMPINTIQNWLAEFNMWLPKESTSEEVRCREFDLFIVNESLKNLHSRAKVILDWQKSGGVLLMGYELFRLLSLKKSYKSKKKKRDVEEENARNKELIEEVYSALVVPGPDLVICDEGHRIKNSHATTSQALKQIRTKRRIVLTGYPLQNNLLEYWCMVDFVRPNYLGTKTEFSNMFERPIQNGQCIDSTPQDKRLMRFRAHVLHSLLEGFVQRRSHAVLQSTLPEKEEYVLLLRFTPFQRKLYDTFMNEVVRTVTVPNPLKAFAVCCKIWNHPDVLYNFLKKKGEEIDLDLEEALPPSLQIPQYPPYGQQSTTGPDGMNPQNPMMGNAPWPRRGPGSRGGKVRPAANRRNVRGRKPAATIPPNVIGGPDKGPREGEGFGQFNPNENYQNQNEGMENFQGRTTFNQNQFGFGNEYNNQTGYPGVNYNKTPPANLDGMSANSFQNKRFFSQTGNETGNSNQYGNPQGYGHGSSDSNFNPNGSNEPNVNSGGFESNLNSSRASYNQNEATKPYDFNPDYEPDFYSNSGFQNPGPNANYPSDNKNSGGGGGGGGFQNNPTYFPNPGFRNADSFNYPTAGANVNPSFQGYERSNFQNPSSNPNFQGNSGSSYQNPNEGFPGNNQRMRGNSVGHSPGYQNSIQDSNSGNFRSNYQHPESNYDGNRNSNSFRGQNENPGFHGSHGSGSSFEGNRSGNYQTQNTSPSFQGQNPSPNFQDPTTKFQGQNTSPSYQSQGPSPNYQSQGPSPNYQSQGPSSNFQSQGPSSNFPSQGPSSNFQSQNLAAGKFQDQAPSSNFQNPNPGSKFPGQNPNFPVQDPSGKFQGQGTSPNYQNQSAGSNYQGQSVSSKFREQNPGSNFQGQNSNFSGQNQSSSFQGNNYGQGFWPQSDWGTCGYPETTKANTDFRNSGNSNSSNNNNNNNTTNEYMSQKFNSFDEGQEVKNENKVFSSGNNSGGVFNKTECDYQNFGKSESDGSKFPEFSEENKVNKTKEEDEVEKKEDVKNPDTPIKKEDSSLPYDWATDLFKTYVTGVLENSSKMEVFFHIVTESIKLGDRLLLFSQSLLTLDLIEDYLHRRNVPDKEEVWAKNKNYFRLDGSTPGLEREKLINEFNANPGIHLFLVSTRAGSLGINLVGANRVVVFDASWNPCHDTQAVCRVYRYGQQKPCFVYRLVMDSCLEKKIYDRQVNKQGMADRVVDELNPDAHLSIKEVTNLCWDDQEDTTVKDFSHLKDNYNDEIIKILLDRCSKLLSKEPFQHESLLIDRKEKKLSQAEKRLAKRSYELEKQAANQPKNIYSFFPNSNQRSFVKPIASVRPMQSEIGSRGMSPQLQNRSKWIPAEVWQKQGMSAQEMTLPLDVVIPTSSPEKTSIVLKAGQRVMVLKSPKGIYMQLENGKIIAIRSAFKVGQNGPGGSNKQEEVKKDTATSMQSTMKTNTNVGGVTPKVSQPVRPALMKPQQQQQSQSQQQSQQQPFFKPFTKVTDKKVPVNMNMARSRQVMGKAKPFVLNRKYESVSPDIKQKLMSGKMNFGNQEDKFTSGQQQQQQQQQQHQHQHQHHQHQHQHQQHNQHHHHHHHHHHPITKDITSMDERIESKAEEKSFSMEEKVTAPSYIEKTEEKREGKREMNDSLETLRKVTESIPDAAKREDAEGDPKYSQMNPLNNYRHNFTSQTKMNPPDIGEKNRESERELGEVKTGGNHPTPQQQGGENVPNWLMNQSYPPMDHYGNYFPGYYPPYGPGPGHMMPPYDGFYPPGNYGHPMSRNSPVVPPIAKQPATDPVKANPQPAQPAPNPVTQNVQNPPTSRNSQAPVSTPMYPPYPNPYPYPYHNYHGNPSFNNQGFPFPNQSQSGHPHPHPHPHPPPPSSNPTPPTNPTQGQNQSNPHDSSMYSAFHRPDATPPFQAPENPYPAPYPRPPYPNSGTSGFFPYNPPYPPNYPYGHNFNPYMHPPGYGYPMQNPPHLNQTQNPSHSSSSNSMNRSNSGNANVS